MRARRLVIAVVAAITGTLLAAPAATASGIVGFPVPSAGCGHPAPVPAGQSVTRTVTSGGLTRSYLLHVPADYRPDRPDPLVLSFHGHGRTAEYQEELSGFSGRSVIAVYPQGLIGTDGKSAWTGAPYSAAADDVLFTSDLLNQVQRELCVDPRRVFAAGKSNGGGFTGVLACRLSGRIAAFAPVSGAFYPQGGECHPSRPAPVLDFHGTADTTIPYAGDPARGLPSIPDWLAGWASRDGCAPEPVVRDLGDGVRVERWRSCDADVVHYRVEGLGHDWPSTAPNPDSDVPSVIDATPVILRFFSAHPLR
ncbi:ferulic acid esterase [Amycolatopsis sp. NPDC006125]|uniref:alpha/beta hydrolase family esterase n=1 Tax=Amycolatopsis sp. NPDC006125 TaxID=3156730 RepID=UPI0033BB5683